MPFEKGKSGNPAGRRKEKKFTDALSAALEADDKKRLYRLRDKLLDEAEAGQSWAMVQVLDRYEGKVPQGIVGDDDYDPVNVLTKIERVIVKAKD